MKQRTRELWRKAAHVVIGTACLIAAYFVSKTYGSKVLELSLAAVLAALLACDILIADYGRKLPFYHWLQRPHEIEGFHSATLGFAGSIIAYKLFAVPVAFAAIAMLIYGDAAAAFAGIFAGTGKRKVAFWRIFAMLAVSVIIGWIFLGWVGVAMGIVAVLAECLAKNIDDALTIPVFAGLAGQLLLWILY